MEGERQRVEKRGKEGVSEWWKEQESSGGKEREIGR